jgi:putative ABC transport system ATP-binding protein
MFQTASSGGAAVRVSGVSRHHRMGRNVVRALDGISLEVRRGEFLAVLGSSGSGKSTLLNLMAGLDRPTSGDVIVMGRNLAALTPEELARYRRLTVGMVFQAFNLIGHMTVAENVELPMRFAEIERGEREARVREAIDRVGLTARAHHRPAELSGGEQQRVALARALINRPPILLADEPTGNLDSRTGAEILALLREVNQSLTTTVAIVTHQEALAERYAERKLHLADGKLVSADER